MFGFKKRKRPTREELEDLMRSDPESFFREYRRQLQEPLETSRRTLVRFSTFYFILMFMFALRVASAAGDIFCYMYWKAVPPSNDLFSKLDHELLPIASGGLFGFIILFSFIWPTFKSIFFYHANLPNKPS